MENPFPFGGEPIRNDEAAVSTSSVSVSPSRKREELTITNTGLTNITLSFGKEAISGKGVFLPPYSTYFSTRSETFRVITDEIFAISSAAGGTLAIFER